MINVDDWAEIRRLYFSEKLGIKTIARRLGVARNTVRTSGAGRHPGASPCADVLITALEGMAAPGIV